MTGAVGEALTGAKGASRPSADEVQAELEIILGSNAFDASDRNRRFLRYVVEETLAGRGSYIKGYTVAQSVFGRASDFDPQLDPVVRIEAGRLRRSLERYYLTVGRGDSLVIELPKGGYVPRFERSSISRPVHGPATAAEGSPPLRLQRYGPSLIVLPFRSFGGGHVQEMLACGITEELIQRLLGYKELAVISAERSFMLTSAADPIETGRKLTLRYALKGRIRADDDRLRISIQLLDVEDARYLWAESFDRNLTSGDLWAVQEEIAAEVAARVAAPSGAIARVSREALSRDLPAEFVGYHAVLMSHGYRRLLTAVPHAEARLWLEHAVEANPIYAEAWAHLATVYVDEYRFGYNQRPEPLQRAFATAERAVNLAEDSALSHLAISLVQHFLADYEGAYRAARHAIELSPDNPEVLTQAAARFAMSGAWDEAMPLVHRAMEHDPDPSVRNGFMLALDCLRRDRYEDALRYREAATFTRRPDILLVFAGIAGAVGAERDAAATVELACTGGRDWRDLWNQLVRYIRDDKLMSKIRCGLERAGFAP
jgi:adenylate cyclase